MLRYIYSLALLTLGWSLASQLNSVRGPVTLSNFPDPTFIEADGAYYAFGTAGRYRIPVATSKDFYTWTVSNHSALPEVGAWSTGLHLWAPDVKKIGGQYVMYYSARPKTGGHHCIGAATSPTPAGPYTPEAKAVVCNQTGGGVIDAFGFTDADNSNWLLYKVDGNSLGHGGSCNNGIPPYIPTPIMAQRMSSDGLVADSSAPVQLLDRSARDGPLVEAPAILRVPTHTNGSATYFLFFSSGCYDASNYDSSYAVSFNGILGPYTKADHRTAPILRTGYPDAQLYGPGGLSTGVDGDNKVVFHAHRGKTATVRQMWVGSLHIDAIAGTVTLA